MPDHLPDFADFFLLIDRQVFHDLYHEHKTKLLASIGIEKLLDNIANYTEIGGEI